MAQQDFHLLQEALKEGKKTLLEEEVEGGTRFLCPEVRLATDESAARLERLPSFSPPLFVYRPSYFLTTVVVHFCL